MSRVGAVQRKNMMRNALLTILVLAFFGTLLCSPVSQQSAQAQMFGGLKASAADGGNLVTLVRRGGGGRGHVAHRGGGRAMHAYRGGGRAMHAYRGGGKFYGHGGARRYAYNRGHYDNFRRYADHGAYRRYGYYGGYRRYGYYGVYPRLRYYSGGYGYYGGGCGWLYRNAVSTGSAYWWNRYYACRGY
jgi:hypothetical protein